MEIYERDWIGETEIVILDKNNMYTCTVTDILIILHNEREYFTIIRMADSFNYYIIVIHN